MKLLRLEISIFFLDTVRLNGQLLAEYCKQESKEKSEVIRRQIIEESRKLSPSIYESELHVLWVGDEFVYYRVKYECIFLVLLAEIYWEKSAISILIEKVIRAFEEKAMDILGTTMLPRCLNSYQKTEFENIPLKLFTLTETMGSPKYPPKAKVCFELIGQLNDLYFKRTKQLHSLSEAEHMNKDIKSQLETGHKVNLILQIKFFIPIIIVLTVASGLIFFNLGY